VYGDLSGLFGAAFGFLFQIAFYGVIIYAVVETVNRSTRGRATAPVVLADRPPATPLVTGDVFAGIRRSDPTFTWEAFCARAAAAYEVVQRARMVGQPEMARKFMTSELLTGFDNAEVFHAGDGASRTLAPIDLVRIEFVRASQRHDYSLIAVRILGRTTVAGRNAILGEQTSDLGARPTASADVDEVWTFKRAIGAVTMPSISDERCPSCGAPLEDAHATNCGYCGMLTRPHVEDDWNVTMVALSSIALAPGAYLSLTESELA
jgi:hypothetical protein